MSERQLEQLDRLSSLFEKVTDDAVATLKELDIARRTNDGWRWGDDSRVSSGWTIVAWMPLPEVYKESK